MNLFQNAEPSVESDDVHERIEARRIRIQKRKEKSKSVTQTETLEKVSSKNVSTGKGVEDISSSKETTPTTIPSVEEPVKEELSLAKKQINESMHILEKLINDGFGLVTNVQVAIDARQLQMREENKNETETRNNKLEHEDKVGKERFSVVNKKWEEVFMHNLPEELYEGLMDQKSACDCIIEEKNKLIASLKQELTNKEERFVKNIRLQTEDINMIIERMYEHVRIMKSAYKEELYAMEMAFVQERHEMLETFLQKWNEILNGMGVKEDLFLKERFKLMDSCEEQVDHLWRTEMEEFNNVKQTLENDIMQLELEARNLKASVLLNQEKLEYNYHVLKKRDEESTIMKSNQKRRLTKLHDIMANLKKKLQKIEKQAQDENKRLLDDFKKIVNLLLTLEKQYNHFQAVDIKKYTEIWQLNEDEAKTLAKKLMNLDRIIHEQYLAVKWTSPDISVMKNIGPWGHCVGSEKLRNFSPVSVQRITLDRTSEKSISEALTAKVQTDVKRTEFLPDDEPTFSESEERLESEETVATQPPTAHGTQSSEQHQFRPMPTFKKEIATTAVGSILHRVLLLLCDESGFLIEDRVRRLLEALPTSTQNLVKITNIFAALGIFHEKEMKVLLKYFLKYSHRLSESGFSQTAMVGELKIVSELPTSKRTSQVLKQPGPVPSVHDQSGERRGKSWTNFSEFRSQMSRRMLRKSSTTQQSDSVEGLISRGNAEVISPNDILKALREFVEEHRKVTRVVEKVPILNCYQLVRNKKDDEKYWLQYSGILPPEHIKLMNALLPALETFHKNLVEREKLLKETNSLRIQNSDLKRLLQQYMKSKTNTEFVVSPTRALSTGITKK